MLYIGFRAVFLVEHKQALFINTRVVAINLNMCTPESSKLAVSVKNIQPDTTNFRIFFLYYRQLPHFFVLFPFLTYRVQQQSSVITSKLHATHYYCCRVEGSRAFTRGGRFS